MTTENLSQEDQEFLAEAEEELKDRFTEKDENFMKVFNLEPSVPPIMENWYPSSGRRNFRRFNDRPNYRDRSHYGRDGSDHGSRDRNPGSYNERKRGYNDYEDDRRRRRY